MSEWIVYSKDGKTERCRLKSLEYVGTWMGERAVTATFEYHSEVAFEVFDYIEYRGEVFELEAVPTVKKTSSFNYSYELRFVSKKYELERCEMRDLVPNDNGVVYPTPLTFSFTGDVRYLVERIQACLDALYGEGVWNIVVADGVTSEEKNITIAQQNCWNALALVNTTYGLNFYVKGRTITIGGTQPAVAHTFEYGKGNGLYEIERASDTEKGIVTKLRAYGGTRNLDYSYPKQPEWSDSALPVSFALSPLRLMLPSFKTDGKTDFVLADDAAIAKYGIREASMVYDDIYPTITGATNSSGQAIDEIKAVDAVDDTKSTFTIYLYDLGFDLEEHLTTSEEQISMKSGTLQGYTFNISTIEKQSDGGYKLVLGRNSLEGSDESGFYVPNADWNMKAGDKFVLLNILMPQAYIREAEERLLARAKEYLVQYGKTNFSYNIGLHNKFLMENVSVYDSLLEGSKLSVRDAEIGIDEDVTIQSITITENMEENILPQVKVTLNNEPSASTLDRIQGKLNDIANETAANNFSSQSELMAQYRKKLDKPFFDKLFVAVDANGNEIASNDITTPVAYIKALYDFAVVGGVTMYVNDKSLNIPGIYEGLPIDGKTLYWDGGVLKAMAGESGGGIADSVAWVDVYGKPSWITDSKPVYSYSEINGTPDLSVYATTEYLAAELKKYVTLNTEQTIAAHKNFLNGLQIGGLGITKSQDDVVYINANLVVRGGITMYATDAIDVPSIIDSLPTASTSAKGLASFDPNFFSVDANGNVSFIGSTGITEVNWTDVVGRPTLLSSFINDQGFASTLGELTNVGSWADSAPTEGRLLYQAKDSRVWTYKNVSDFVSENGLYLPLTGGVLTGNLEVTSITHSSPYATNIDNFGNLVFGSSGLDWSIKSNDQNKIVTLYNTGKLELNGRVGSDVPLTILSSHNQGLVIRSIATETSINYNAEAYGTSWTTGINIKNELPNSYCVYSTTKNENVLKFRGSDGRGFVKFGIEFENSGLTTYATNGITIGGGDAAERYITCYGKNVGYINIGKSPSTGNTGELSFHYYGDRSGNMLQFGFYGGGSSDIRIYYNSHTQVSGNLLTTGGITMYSDIRKKTKLADVELSLKQIADAPLIEHYYNIDAMRTTHVGSIAQYWAGLNDWFCKKDSEGFYTMEIQNAALASAISIARELVKYESETDKEIRLLKDEVKRLKKEIKILKSA